MFKKILITTALIAVTGLLIFGAINRTQAKTGDDARVETTGGYGRNSHETEATGHSDELMMEKSLESQGGYGRNSQNNVEVDRPEGEYLGRNAAAVTGYGRNSRSSELSAQPIARETISNGHGHGSGDTDSHTHDDLTPIPLESLSAQDIDALMFMREEEKLAHDVYTILYEKWGLPIFTNISRSEQTHADAVRSLMDRAGLTDTTATTAGVFNNPELQALYNELITRGSQSVSEALKVGAAIEEIDILDLQKRLAQTQNIELQHTFTNLLNGSYNHLNSFVSTLQTQTGELYQPVYLDLETYQGIINTGSARGQSIGRQGDSGGREQEAGGRGRRGQS